jgi:hypothetical protein
MKRLVLVAVGAAVAGLTACSQTPVPSAVSASSSTAGANVTSSAGASVTSSPGATHSAVAVTCKQQYDTWKNGPGKGLVARLSAVSSAEAAGNVQALTAALRNAEPALARAARHPLPGCADPKGYWEVLLMHINAAAGTRSASTLRAAMIGVPKITRELIAELNRADG